MEKYKIGSYEIFLDQQVGVGSYSAVYIGRCVDSGLIMRYGLEGVEKKIGGVVLNGIVAIKKILVQKSSFRQQKLVKEEVAIVLHIRDNPNENVVRYYDVIDDLDTIYIVMEYCENGDLSKIMGRGPMGEEDVRYYFVQLIKGVRYLDENKIIHRDIKPKNILLTGGDASVLKICDFGLAKNKSGLSRVYTACGSPLYMAPEMFGEKSYNDTVDVWSIGIILYEMLYGINPFGKMKDYNELELFMLDGDDEIVIPPKNKNIFVSDSCLDLLRSLLTKNNETRITLAEVYNHKWLSDDTQDPGDIPKTPEKADTDLDEFFYMD
ncbi:MAG: serine/threonine protein kinase [Hyperionvirus sp.]|uniref:Serine/threonine protein kinase n=1 Tax=Hyperionvirus sp. TaxID=2487770 RepID=A0A3G5ABP5_9VIRU|nr:MAG: serine/threonine protein kinase [Hyperionvirus sp.]